jgi:HEAT repeat protein/beta-lactamase regulating signal transducer with metallopeptidase domain
MSFTNLLTTLTAGGFPWIPIADAVVKASVLLGLAGVAALVLRRSSASVRHLIWTVALAGAMAVPALSIALPRWRVNVVPVPATLALAAADEQAPVPGRTRPAARARTDAGAASTLTQSAGAGVTAASPDVTLLGRLARVRAQTMVLALWFVGFLLVGARLAAGLIGVHWMSRRFPVVRNASWLPLARELASRLGIAADVRFLRSTTGTMPMAWGLVRPTVLMPADADTWPVERLRMVLLHELAHVRRRDCLTHLLAQAACAVYWFHPLAWMAARRARAERERACDDLVLAAGTRGSDYAEELLQIARVMRTGPLSGVLGGVSLAMAQRSQLEGRLLAILDPAVPRNGLTRARVLATCVACCAGIMPLAALEPRAQELAPSRVHAVAVPVPSALQRPNVPPPPSRRSGLAPVTTARAQDGRLVPAAPASGTDRVQAGEVPGRIERAVSQSITDAADGAQQIVASALDGALAAVATFDLQAAAVPAPDVNPNPNPNPKPAGSAGPSKPSDPRTVAALTAALKDSDKEVRETAMQALVQMRDPSIFDPLVEALRDASADVREQAAFGLGQLRDRRAVEPLVGAMKDVNPSVREQAVFALGQLRDPRALDALAAALKDALPDVREQAAFSLGQLRDKRATAPLAAALGDASDAVREQAVFALGQLRDPAALDGLTTALRDARPKVREQAAFSLGHIRDGRAVDPLVAALKDSDADVRQQAAFALGQIRERASVEALVLALKDPHAQVREQVAFALGQLRDPRAIDALTTALKDANPSVRQNAAFALGRLAR